MSTEKPVLIVSERAGEKTISLKGAWVTSNAQFMDNPLQKLPSFEGGKFIIDASGVTSFDTYGAWLINNLCIKTESAAKGCKISGMSPQLQRLVKTISTHEVARAEKPKEMNFFIMRLKSLGSLTADLFAHYGQLFTFIGFVLVRFMKALWHPKRFRLTSLVFHLEKAGFNALFIVGLMTFLIGAVIVNQGAIQLRQFGAEVFTVDLLAVSLLREMGILLAAILIAGRSGSAFTAEIGSMKIREEVDALQVIGLNPVDVLVLPRMIALILVMPLIAFFADIMGVIGGALMAYNILDISFEAFFARFRESIEVSTFFIGIIKAPFFGAIIAINGCYEGLSVTGSAESVGRNTTRSVVQSIFLVIVMDALFAMFFSAIGW